MKTEIQKWNPFPELGTFSNRFNHLFPSMWSRHSNGEDLLSQENWEPAVDIEEDDEKYTITADLPNVKKEDIKVTVRDGILTLSGERNQESESEDKTYHQVERFHGSYQRSFALPDHVKDDEVVANLRDGVLQVILPKEEESSGNPEREITID